MSEFVIYHNPRCSKSRTALEMLRHHGIEPRIVEYLKTPPTAAELQALLQKLGLQPRDILRDSEPDYRKLKLDDPATSDTVLIEALVQHPILLQRPIIVRGARAVVGRPPEKVLQLV